MTLQAANESYRSLIDLLQGLDPTVQYSIANSIWYRQGFQVESRFRKDNEQYFDAVVSGLNFASPGAVSTINGWVGNKTNNRIPTIVQTLSPSTVMILLDAIYFKAAWTHPFKRDATRLTPFVRAAGDTVAVQTMTGTKGWRLYTDSVLVAADLPYGNGPYALTVLMPRVGSGLDGLLTSLEEGRWSTIAAGLHDACGMPLFLPRFRIESDVVMNDVLKTLGMAIAFDPLRADFTRINTRGGLYIDEVKHKTYVDVNEDGSEASSATLVGVNICGSMNELHVNRPFMFVIRERLSGTILFTGRVMDPS